MAARTTALTLVGVNAHRVSVEAEVSRGLRRFVIIGLPDGVVKEARDRVRLAISNSGFFFPKGEVIVNLSPASLPKRGSGFDLAIALSVLAASRQIPAKQIASLISIAELGLRGEVRATPGTLAGAVELRSGETLIGSLEALSELPEAVIELPATSKGENLFGAENLFEIVSFLNKNGELLSLPGLKSLRKKKPVNSENKEVFADVVGQESAKRALCVAAAGGHHLLMVGPPGSGKSMLARRMSGLLPELTSEEELEVRKVLDSADQAFRGRPFRSPHHTCSYVGLVGGGSFPRPGEVSLAHQGVLFLDELPEFKRDSIESLRQPLETKDIHISRGGQKVCFPANFLMVAAMNPCPCGLHPEPSCVCQPRQISNYVGKISSALLDRIDVEVQVRAVPLRDLLGSEESGVPKKNLNSLDYPEMVKKARTAQLVRQGKLNSQLIRNELLEDGMISAQGREFLEKRVLGQDLSARSLTGLLKVSRTVADLDNQVQVEPKHLSEAYRYRNSFREKNKDAQLY